LKKYAAIFTVAYLVLTIICALLASALKMKGGAGLNIAATLASGFIAAWAFNRENARLPTDEEKKSFAWQSVLGAMIISACLVVAFFFSLPGAERRALLKPGIDPSLLMLGSVVLVIFSAIYYFAIRWSFSWYTKLAYKP
jgi:hypothetical protein